MFEARLEPARPPKLCDETELSAGGHLEMPLSFSARCDMESVHRGGSLEKIKWGVEDAYRTTNRAHNRIPTEIQKNNWIWRLQWSVGPSPPTI